MLCNICCDEKKNVFKCLYCDYESCVSCNEHYILDTMALPSCTSCRKEFPSDFFYQHFSATFINKKYKAHREKILYDREKSLLPATMAEVVREETLEKLENERNELIAQRNELTRKIQEKNTEMDLVKFGEEVVAGKQQKKQNFVGPCPKQDCRGFLSDNYNCALCNTNACNQCLEVKTENHKCNADTIETVKELRNSTRACPSCHTRIYRIMGCDQMFCTQCHVAFSWEKGEIENGVIHNPHYYAYLRENGGVVPRNPNEIRCGGMPNPAFLWDRRFKVKADNMLKHMKKTYDDIQSYLTNVHRTAIHIRQVVIADLPTVFDNTTNQDLRIEFLRNKIDEKTFMLKLQRREKDRNKKLERRQILETYCNVVQDLFTTLSDKFDYNEFIESEMKIRSHTCHSYDQLNAKYNSKISYDIY